MVTSIHHSFFSSPQDALDIVQICKDDQEQAFAMLAAVLWLGNISFQVIDNGNHVEVLANEGKIDIILSKLNCQLSVLANSR
jgi:myosin-5